MTHSSSNAVLKDVWMQCRPALVWAGLFSALVNILYLTPTIFMMQVYDRAVPSASGGTLLLLTLVAVGGLGTLALLDWLRGRLLVRVSARIERLLAGQVLDATMVRPDLGRLERQEAMRDFDTVRQSMTGHAMIAIFDAPWAPIYLLVAFLLHPFLGLTTTVAAAILVTLAWLNERATHAPITAANDVAAVTYAKLSQVVAYSQEVRALGMREALTAKSLEDRGSVVRLQVEASMAAGRYGALIKFMRLVFQSLALVIGAWLAISGRLSMGSIMAASLLLTRTLSPIEQIVGAWKGLVGANAALGRMRGLLDARRTDPPTRLPGLRGAVAVEKLTVATRGGVEVLTDVAFAIKPGESVGLAGLSGAGKSTLLRVLTGSVAPRAGSIRYDGAAMADWDAETLARSIGYLPQDFVLFPGTIKHNISRFDAWRGVPADTIDADAVAAAQAVGAHDMILRLPQGYDTLIGQGGVGLSAGQTQRVALARAFYGRPRIVILDEPNAHLDADASAMLFESLARLKRDGVTVLLAAHSAAFLAACDRLLLITGGRIVERDPQAARPPAGAAPAPLAAANRA